MKKHNFYAGPSILSEYTIRNTADAIINFADMGLSILEVSHREEGLIRPFGAARSGMEGTWRSSFRAY